MELSWGDKIFAFHGDAVLQISRYGIQNKLHSNALPQKTFCRGQLSPQSYLIVLVLLFPTSVDWTIMCLLFWCFQPQQEPNQWNGNYYGYGQSYDSYGYAAPPQDPNVYAYAAYPGYGNYQQQAQQQQQVKIFFYKPWLMCIFWDSSVIFFFPFFSFKSFLQCIRCFIAIKQNTSYFLKLYKMVSLGVLGKRKRRGSFVMFFFNCLMRTDSSLCLCSRKWTIID